MFEKGLKTDLIKLFFEPALSFSLLVKLNSTAPIIEPTFKCPNLLFLAQELMSLVAHKATD
jgi:hypothetical protein